MFEIVIGGGQIAAFASVLFALPTLLFRAPIRTSPDRKQGSPERF
jgi:hypothetical protein